MPQTANKQVGRYEVKQIGPEEDRVLRFVGTDESPDRDGDIIKVDGWKLDNYLKNPVFLPFHNYWAVPLGRCVNISRSAGALTFDIKFASIAELSSNPDTPSDEALDADTIYMAYKNGFMSAVSVGFIGIESEERKDQDNLPTWQRGRVFTEQELLELSAVAVPSNPNALQMARSIKEFGDDRAGRLQKMFDEHKDAIPHKNSILSEPEGQEVTIKEVQEAIKEATAPLLEQIKSLESVHVKAGAKFSAATLASMQECYDHMTKGYESVASGMAKLKGLMDGDGSEPGGQSTTDTEPQTDVDGDVDAAGGKTIDLSGLELKNFRLSGTETTGGQ